MFLVEHELLTSSDTLSLHPVIVGLCCLVFCVVFFRLLFVLFIFSIILSVLLLLTSSDYPFLINFDLLAFISSSLSIQYRNFHWANTAKTYNADIFRIGPIPVTARSESARRFDNRKEKSREMSVVC